MPEATAKPLLLLVDGHSLAFRSFYAFSKGGEGGLATKDGRPTSVTYGFLKALLDNSKSLKPEGVAIAFDTAEPTFRHKADANYKAHRDVAPEVFFQDLEQLQQILETHLQLPLCIAPGFEADDVLGTLANRAADTGWGVRILSGDRDLFQLVDDSRDIAVLYMGGGPYAKSSGPMLIREEGVLGKLGVMPDKVVDLKALTGDSSDNIPGVRGVGPKTAINLLKENSDLDAVYATLEQVEAEGPKASRGAIKGALKGKLRSDHDNAYLSRKLAEILVDVPLPKEPSLPLSSVDGDGLRSCLEDLELNSLLRQVGSFVAAFSEGGYRVNAEAAAAKTTRPTPSEQPTAGAAAEQATDEEVGLPALKPQLIQTEAALDALVQRLMACTDSTQPVALDTETTDLNPFRAELVGIGICWDEALDALAYIPLGHKGTEDSSPEQLALETVLTALAPWLASNTHPKTLQNAKYDRLILLRHGVALEGVVIDTLLADYLRDAAAKHGLELMAEREFGLQPTSFTDLVGKKQTFADVPLEPASLYCGMDVHVTRRLALLLHSQLEGMGPQLLPLLEQVEQPLEPVLALMESTGIRIDVPYLQGLSEEMGTTLQRLESEAKEAAGVEFNLASPKQLGELLFDTLGLDRKKSRRTKTGFSTDATVLEKLGNDHPVVPLVLEHRVLSKLKSTYIDALPQLVEAETGRVHTDFNQAVTATGRLSSSNPNLQNIPVRTEYSRRIRKAFLPQEGWTLLSADYSQIELRILTHLSGEEVLQEAYRSGDDVHALTARLLLDKDKVSPDERRLGKTINFGVIYGMGAQRFARETGVNQSEAKDFLAKYKQRYPKVFAFLELQERLALSRGYVETILGRRRPFHFDRNGLGRLLGKDPLEIDLDVARRGGMEAQQLRAAANAPIQGSSADIIKVAMVQLQAALQRQGLPAQLLLQVHDELVLEVAPDALKALRELVVKTMEQAVELTVPLVVETGVGANWMEAK
ncbi:DNA polymerase I [Synechococcus sp. HB1133]|uniref:DNA polymerase I n=1 Tax=unclassified Synechococcus TaxID=2626047 RepID=UPI001407D966|nr:MULTISPECIES: DNA polymerase I [unclassified Synechococcus]MCB4394402.1 DNA polymerase I [Synechococcus sp. PH41509]MCB4422755.1 DNA polymerase I [Synechococcus sp. HB1133]MCB4430281.1 DNA polymerase I [Synechococcus sp. HBA1120]NHI81703.1 DNA polymerase I [Synechococcus sp. HB1133]